MTLVLLPGSGCTATLWSGLDLPADRLTPVLKADTLGGEVDRLLTVLPPRRFAIEGSMTARERRAVAGRRLYDQMSEMILATSNIDRTLFAALLDAADVPYVGDDTCKHRVRS